MKLGQTTETVGSAFEKSQILTICGASPPKTLQKHQKEEITNNKYSSLDTEDMDVQYELQALFTSFEI